jgi:large subunit ribosomal protein L4
MQAMGTVEVTTIDKKKAGEVTLDPAIFEVKVKPDLLHAEVRRQLALRRAGTHSTKNRAAVSGGGSKPWRQKGTGRARQGTTRAVQWAGGGVAFGPVPRSYEHNLPKKVRRAALKSALSLRCGEGALTVVEALPVDDFKTKRVREMLEGLSLADSGVLIVIDEADPKLERSARNLPNVAVVRVAGLNVYDVLRHEKLLVTRAAVAAIETRLARTARHGAEGAES